MLLLLFISSCSNKSSETVTEEKTEQNDSAAINQTREFIDLLFAQQSLPEINQLASRQIGGVDSVWALFREVEKLKVDYPRQALKILEYISTSEEVRTRLKIWAWNAMRDLGETTTKEKVLGLLLEVPQENTTEYLAIYDDGTAYYINYSGRVGALEAKDPKMDSLVHVIISASQQYAQKEKLSKGRSTDPTPKVRFNFLTNTGVYQTEKSMQELQPGMGEPSGIFQSAIQVLMNLVEHENSKR